MRCQCGRPSIKGFSSALQLHAFEPLEQKEDFDVAIYTMITCSTEQLSIFLQSHRHQQFVCALRHPRKTVLFGHLQTWISGVKVFLWILSNVMLRVLMWWKGYAPQPLWSTIRGEGEPATTTLSGTETRKVSLGQDRWWAGRQRITIYHLSLRSTYDNRHRKQNWVGIHTISRVHSEKVTLKRETVSLIWDQEAVVNLSRH